MDNFARKIFTQVSGDKKFKINFSKKKKTLFLRYVAASIARALSINN